MRKWTLSLAVHDILVAAMFVGPLYWIGSDRGATVELPAAYSDHRRVGVECSSVGRARKCGGCHKEIGGAEVSSGPDARPSPEHRVFMREVHSVLDAAVASLPDNYRSVLLLRAIEETDTRVTAKRLNISSTNVKVRLHRARAMLREYLLKIMYADPGVSAQHGRPPARARHCVQPSNHKHLTSFGHRRDTCKHAPA